MRPEFLSPNIDEMIYITLARLGNSGLRIESGDSEDDTGQVVVELKSSPFHYDSGSVSQPCV